MDIKVYESKRGTAWIWAGLSAAVGLVLLSQFGAQRSSDIFTPGVVVAGIVFATYYFARLARNPPTLRVRNEALVIERPGKPPTVVPWNQIDSFVVVRRRGLELLGYRLRKGAPKPMFSGFGRFFEGADEVLYGFWPQNAKTMVAALTLYLQQLRDLNAPDPAAQQIVSSPASAPRTTPDRPPSRPLRAPVQAPQAVSEPRRLFGAKAPPTDASGNKPIVW